MTQHHNHTKILLILQETLSKLGVTVRYEDVMTDDVPSWGGFCTINKKEYLIIDRRAPLDKKIDIFVEALKRYDTEAIYIPPLIREMLRDHG